MAAIFRIGLSVCLSVCLSVYLCACRSIILYICLSLSLSVWPSICLCVCWSIYPPLCLCVCRSIFMCVWVKASYFRGLNFSILWRFEETVFVKTYSRTSGIFISQRFVFVCRFVCFFISRVSGLFVYSFLCQYVLFRLVYLVPCRLVSPCSMLGPTNQEHRTRWHWCSLSFGRCVGFRALNVWLSLVSNQVPKSVQLSATPGCYTWQSSNFTTQSHCPRFGLAPGRYQWQYRRTELTWPSRNTNSRSLVRSLADLGLL